MSLENFLNQVQNLDNRRQNRPQVPPPPQAQMIATDQQASSRLFGDKGGNLATMFKKEDPWQHDQNELLRLQYDFDFI